MNNKRVILGLAVLVVSLGLMSKLNWTLAAGIALGIALAMTWNWWYNRRFRAYRLAYCLTDDTGWLSLGYKYPSGMAYVQLNKPQHSGDAPLLYADLCDNGQAIIHMSLDSLLNLWHREANDLTPTAHAWFLEVIDTDNITNRHYGLSNNCNSWGVEDIGYNQQKECWECILQDFRGGKISLETGKGCTKEDLIALILETTIRYRTAEVYTGSHQIRA